MVNNWNHLYDGDFLCSLLSSFTFFSKHFLSFFKLKLNFLQSRLQFCIFLHFSFFQVSPHPFLQLKSPRQLLNLLFQFIFSCLKSSSLPCRHLQLPQFSACNPSSPCTLCSDCCFL
uniref:Myosin-6-like isoform X2 n=1 Tax=Rhizophora mucronata TaxID=61149 RepID=A0A2P2MTY9_RHIMU